MFLPHIEIILLFSWHGLRNIKGQTDEMQSPHRPKRKEKKMKTLKRLVIVCMALALVCVTAPLGHTQGVATPIGKCSPGTLIPSWDRDRACPDIKNYGAQKPAWRLPGSPATGTDLAYGKAPSWSEEEHPKLGLSRPGSTTPPSGGFGYY